MVGFGTFNKTLILAPILSPDIGGPATYIEGLVNHLKSKSLDIVVLRSKEHLSINTIPSTIKNNVKSITFIPFNRSSINIWKRIVTNNFKSLLQMMMAINDHKVIYSLSSFYFGLIVFFKKKKNTRNILRFVGDEVWEYLSRNRDINIPLHLWKPGGIKQVALYRIYKKILHNFDLIIVPSYFLKKYLMKQYSISDSKISVVYNAVNMDNKNLNYKEREKFRAKSDEIICTYVGRIVPWKNLELLIRFFNRLLYNEPKLKLFIAGNGYEKNKLSEIILKSNLIGKVILMGKIEYSEVQNLLKESDIFILISDFEGLNHAVIEAAICDCFVILSDNPGNVELSKFLPRVEVFSLYDLKNDIKKSVNSFRKILTRIKLSEEEKRFDRIEKKDKDLDQLMKLFSWQNHIKELHKHVDLLK